MSKTDYCNPPPHVVTYPTLAIVMVTFVSLAAGFGAFAYGQARDAGAAGVAAAGTVEREVARVDDRVDALALVVAENQLAQARATAEIQSDIRALSLQMVTGRQPEQLRVAPDGGAP